MFSNLEKEYKKISKINQFAKYYWKCAFILFTALSLLFYIISNNYYIYIYIFTFLLFFILIFMYIYNDYKNTMKNIIFNKNDGIGKKIKEYKNKNVQKYKSNLIKLLIKYNFKTREDLKLAIDYYNAKQPKKIQSSFFTWFISTLLTISSFIEIAYDIDKNEINFHKLYLILNSSLSYIIIFTVPILVVRIIIESIFFSNNKLYSQLIDDLSNIYINYDKYGNLLENNIYDKN